MRCQTHAGPAAADKVGQQKRRAAANKNLGRRRIQSLAQTVHVYPHSRLYLQY